MCRVCKIIMELNFYRNTLDQKDKLINKRNLANYQIGLNNRLIGDVLVDEKSGLNNLKNFKANSNSFISKDFDYNLNLSANNSFELNLKENFNNKQNFDQFQLSDKMLNGGMMLANSNLINGNQINGVDASSFSTNLTGNSMNSNTVSGLSPSSSYDSFSPRCKLIFFNCFKIYRKCLSVF